MNSKRRLATLAVVLLGAGLLLWAGEPWQDKPYTEWTPREAAKVLSDSPWARSGEIYLLAPSGGGPADAGRLPDEMSRRWIDPNRYNDAAQSLWQQRTGQRNLPLQATVTGIEVVQWASSLTLRQALVRQGQLYARQGNEPAEALLSLPFEDYVIAVYRSDLPSFTGLSEESARAAAWLELKPSKRKVAPERVHLVRFGDVLMHVEFYFPRQAEGQPVIAPTDTRARFHWENGTHSTTVEFDLRKMVRAGQPDL